MQLRSSSEPSPENRSSSAGATQFSGLSPSWTARILLLAAVLGACDRAYWLYSNNDRYWPTYWMPFIQGTALAPEQYRIGVKMAAWWMVQHFHWGFRHGFALMDLVASVPGILLLHDLLDHRPWYRQASLELRWFASAGFVMLTCFNLAWIESYFRPETLPTTGLVALMVWLWTRFGFTAPNRAREVAICCGLIAAAAVQATIRADVVCILSVGVFAVSTLRGASGLSLRRSAAILMSAICGILAAGIQIYIMRVKYPHASYGPIPIVMVLHDLRQPLTFPPFLFYIVPVAWTALRFWRDPPPQDAANSSVFLASMLYLLLWVVMGKLDEVRIFVPFALALAPLTLELAVRKLQPRGPETDADSARSSSAVLTRNIAGKIVRSTNES